MSDFDRHKKNGSEGNGAPPGRPGGTGSAGVRTKTPLAKPVAPTRVTVCHLSVTLDTGGLERLLAGFARYGDRSRFRLTFVAMQKLGRFAEEIRGQYWPIRHLGPRSRFQQVLELMRFFRRWKVDVLHTHNTYPHIYGTLAARLAGVPVVINTRHGQRFGHNGRSRTAYRWASRFVDRIVAVSDNAAHLCTEADGIDPNKVVRIWNGIDVGEFPFRGSAGRPALVSIARLSAEKDVPTLLQAVRGAVQDVPGLQLRLVGDGPERMQLRRMSNELRLNGHVQFLGERMDVPQLLADAGLFVSSSLTEGLSLTLLEAMAVGLPVVATRVGGNAEVVEEGMTGRLVCPGDPQALAQAITDMCRCPHQWTEMGWRARQRVTKHFHIQRMVAEYEALYSQLMENTSLPARSSDHLRNAAATVR